MTPAVRLPPSAFAGTFLGNARQSNLHTVLNDGRVYQLVRKINKGHGQTALLFCQHGQQFVFVHAVGFTYLTFTRLRFTARLKRRFETLTRMETVPPAPPPANTPHAKGKPKTNVNRPQTSSLSSFFLSNRSTYVRYLA